MRNRQRTQRLVTKRRNRQFLEQLGEDMRTQDNNGQASPRYWVISQQEKKVTHGDFAYDYMYFHNDGDHTDFNTMDDLRTFLTEHYDDKNPSMLELIETDETLTDAFETLMDSFYNPSHWEYFKEYPYTLEDVIRDGPLFLTKKEAEDHIKYNRHHYNSTVHTYSLTAWRSPSIHRLFELLELKNGGF